MRQRQLKRMDSESTLWSRKDGLQVIAVDAVEAQQMAKAAAVNTVDVGDEFIATCESSLAKCMRAPFI